MEISMNTFCTITSFAGVVAVAALLLMIFSDKRKGTPREGDGKAAIILFLCLVAGIYVFLVSSGDLLSSLM